MHVLPRKNRQQGSLEVSFSDLFMIRIRCCTLMQGTRFAYLSSVHRKYAWLLSRTPEVSAERKAHFSKFMHERGFKERSRLFG